MLNLGVALLVNFITIRNLICEFDCEDRCEFDFEVGRDFHSEFDCGCNRASDDEPDRTSDHCSA